MSVDYAFWKPRSGVTVSRGLIYLLVAAAAELPEVELLDAERYREQLAYRFPDWAEEEGEAQFDCELLPTGFVLQTYSDTPDEVLGWFFGLAEKEGLEIFDPQTEPVSRTDQDEFKRRIEAVENTMRAEQLNRDLPDLVARADTGDAKALFELGNLYSFGEGFSRDQSRAFELYMRAAKLGSTNGKFNVAASFRLGEGVDSDLIQAAHWYEKALVQDKLFAAFALGELYSTPEGLQSDLPRAIHYFEIALEHGHQDAKRELRRLGALPPLPSQFSSIRRIASRLQQTARRLRR